MNRHTWMGSQRNVRLWRAFFVTGLRTGFCEAHLGQGAETALALLAAPGEPENPAFRGAAVKRVRHLEVEALTVAVEPLLGDVADESSGELVLGHPWYVQCREQLQQQKC